MADICSVLIVFIQSILGCLCLKPVYERATFPYSKCYQTWDSVSCERINITKAARQGMPSRWPPGPYSVLMTTDQCPGLEASGWKKGVVSIQASTQDKNRTLYFCEKMKRYSEVISDRGKWMPRAYNIFMSGPTCPDGFEEFNRSVAFESFGHHGHVPNFTVIDNSGRRRIVFNMCKKNSTDISIEEDGQEFNTTIAEILREKIGKNEDCYGMIGTSCSDMPAEFGLTSGFLFSTGTIQNRLHNIGEMDVTWYQIDFQRTLPVARIQINNGSGLLKNFMDLYIGCTWNNIQSDFLPSDAESCNETVHINGIYITLKMSYIQARFITLMLNSSESSQTTLHPDLFKIFLFDLPSVEMCNEDLGIRDGSIQKFQIKASSRLYRHMPSRPIGDGWCADNSDSKPWILVDLIAVTRVEGLTIWPGSRKNVSFLEQNTGCLSLNFYHGKDLDVLTLYDDTNFKAKSHPLTYEKTIILLNPIDARYIKLDLKKCIANSSVCIRFELHGCKQSGIPDLNCSGQSDMFELDGEIRPEGNPIKNTHSHENCSALCHRSENCSIVNYTNNSNEEYCSFYPPSLHGMWQITNTSINQWSAKLCGTNYIELFPRSSFRGDYKAELDIFTNVEYIKSNSVIHSIGYPFSYGAGQDYMWIVDFKNPISRYARLAFTNVSLGDEECHAKLLISKIMYRGFQGIEINQQYNDRVFVIETEEDLLFLTFTTCLAQETVTDRGFRVIVTGETFPACFSIERSSQDMRNETCKRQAMIITSLSILNLPLLGKEEIWTISTGDFLHHSLQLELLDFYVVCPNGTGDIRSRFVIVNIAGERPYCNTEKPPPIVNLENSNAIVKYQRPDNSTTVYLRKEGFRLRYYLQDHSLEKLKDTDYFARGNPTVCSKTFGKCYYLQSSLTTWDEASRTCMECDMMLVTIQSDYELQFVNYLLRDFRNLSNIRVSDEDNYLYQASFSSHIGARHVTSSQRKEIYVWENTAPVISFYWKSLNPIFGKACTRTNVQFLSNRTWESEDCSRDLSMMLVCQSQLVEESESTISPGRCVFDKSIRMELDIAFLIDTSASLWTPDFERVKRFILDLVGVFKIDPQSIQLAALTFAEDVKIEFGFMNVRNLEVENQIAQIHHRMGRATMTHLALKEMRLRLFSLKYGARISVQRIGILLTDGVPTMPYLAQKESKLARDNGIRLIGIGIGESIDIREFISIVNLPFSKNFIHLDAFSSLDSDLPEVFINTTGIAAFKSGKRENTELTNWKPLSKINKTFSGTACKIWTKLSTPEKHHLKRMYVDFDVSDDMQNFCQDPGSSGVLWCYSPGSAPLLWEPCFIQASNLEHPIDNNRTSPVENDGIFECGDGKYISQFQECDGIFNCQDFSDETKCGKKAQLITRENDAGQEGRPILFLCGSKEWISISAECDNVIDCADGSDELNCSPANTDNKECTSGEYECKNKQCILLSQRCDGFPDCGDFSDEHACGESKAIGSCINGVRCGNKCIPLYSRTFARYLCDSIPHCVDGYDEAFCDRSSCEQWWKHGYVNSDYYRIDGLKVYCDFTSINTGEITTILQNIDVVLDQGKGLLYTKLGNNFIQFKDLPFHSNNYSCFIEVINTCLFPKLASTIDSGVDRSNVGDCFCTLERFPLDKNDLVLASNLSHQTATDRDNCSKVDRDGSIHSFTDYYTVTRDGVFLFDERIWKGEISAQITPQQIVCKPEFRKDLSHGISSECVYTALFAWTQLDSVRNLQNCGDFKCPSHTVKCPGSYCIPLSFVCDGIVQCPSGEDEFECTCKNDRREILVFAEDTTESKFVAEKIGRQFYTSNSYIRLLYFKTQTPLVDYNIEHRLLEIREERIYLSKILEHSDGYRFKTMARNVLQQIKFSKYNITGVVFIENSFESSKVAELIFSNITNPGFMIYRLFRNVSFTTKYNTPDKHRFVKDVPTHRWNALFYIGYKRFSEICKAATEVPCSGGYRCSLSKQCIPLNLVCDGKPQCPGKDDERLCDYYCPHRCTCSGYNVNCRAANLSIQNVETLSVTTRIADLSQNVHLKDVLLQLGMPFVFMTKLNLSSCGIESVDIYIFSFLNNLRCLDIGYNKIKILPDEMFSWFDKLVYLNLDGNHELQIISHSAFHGLKSIRSLRISGTKLKQISSYTFSYLTLNVLDISNNKITEIEDFAFNSTSVKKIDFRGNNIRTFNTFIFEGVSSLQELQTPDYKFCCIRPCSVDEENCFPLRNEFSSCADLMRHPVLQSMLWIVGSISLLGNFGSILYRLLYDRERLKIGYGIFVTNLAGADFLMGIYLIMIAIADLVFRNRSIVKKVLVTYINHSRHLISDGIHRHKRRITYLSLISFYMRRYIYVDDMWRNSNWCLTAGILSTVSSEASVLFVCLITLDRLLVIKYPFGTVRFEPKRAYLSCIVSWMVALLIAVIPVFYTDYFEDSFYSRSAVCIALPLTRDKPPGWIYSVTIFVGLNFCTFVLVAVGQLSIFLELRKATGGIKETQKSRKRDLQVARNLIFVATTDFLCWFPIGLMGILALSGHPISGDVYAWTAVFILPFNSALNPVLYTLTAILGKRSFNPNIEEQNRTDSLKETASAIVQHHGLLKPVCFKNGKAPVWQNLEVLITEAPLSSAMVVSIAFQVSKYMCFLHDHGVYIEQMSVDCIYLKINTKRKRCMKIFLNSKLSVSNDEKRLQTNIFQFGQLLRKLTAKCNKNETRIKSM